MEFTEDGWFREIVEATTLCGIFVVDSEARIATWNAGAERLFGYMRDEIIGHPYSELFSADAIRDGIPARELAQSNAPGMSACAESWAARKDASQFRACGTIMALRDSSGSVQGYCKCVQDCAVGNDAREELRRVTAFCQTLQAQHGEKDEFISTVSHELRTPLQAMLGWTRLLRAGKLDTTAAGKALEIIERSARTQAHLIEEFLDVSRIITGRLLIEPRNVEFEPIVEEAVEAARPQAAAKNIALNYDSPSTDDCVVHGDPDRLHQIIDNLLNNALKFTPAGGRIQVKLVKQADSVKITVGDTGKGIAPDSLPHIFEGFKHTEAQSCSKSGLGFGLAIVHHILELHGGTIKAESPGLAQGATFTVELPLAKELGEERGMEETRAANSPDRP
jgi:PAS domain S-box-containing protein